MSMQHTFSMLYLETEQCSNSMVTSVTLDSPDNLPEGCCVEVPVLASRRGLDPIHVGPLPPQLAILNNVNAGCEELAVEAALTGDKRKVFHAICMDPLTSAVLSLQEIQDMVDEMFEVNKDWLPHFK